MTSFAIGPLDDEGSIFFFKGEHADLLVDFSAEAAGSVQVTCPNCREFSVQVNWRGDYEFNKDGEATYCSSCGKVLKLSYAPCGEVSRDLELIFEDRFDVLTLNSTIVASKFCEFVAELKKVFYDGFEEYDDDENFHEENFTEEEVVESELLTFPFILELQKND